jgi:uncharacterized protein
MVAMARIPIVVSPGSARTELVGRHGEAWKIRVSAPPERGRANSAVVELLASLLDVPRADVSVVAGGTARRKVVEVVGLDADAVAARLAAAAAARDR